MKVSTSDLLAILRKFGLAGDSNIPREIDQIKQSHPLPINQLVVFRFARTKYYALFDETAEDNQSYILQQLGTGSGDLHGQLLQNPTSNISTFGLPYKGKHVYLFQRTSTKVRLDSLLAARNPETSRSTWQKLIKSGRVSVNGVAVESPKHEVTQEDSISVVKLEPQTHSTLSLPIVYIDDHVIVVDKPAGVLTHSKGALNDEFTVADFFRRYSDVGLDTTRPGIVHRLDRDTSGLIIGARTSDAFSVLKRQFSERIAKKTYYAVVDGHLKLPRARIDVPIGRDPKHPSTFRPHSNGKSSVTDYATQASSDKYELVRLTPLTGRTHQLRVHMAHLGTPIHGDRVYGKAADRLYLHATQLEITLPSGERKTFSSELPKEFKSLIDYNEAIILK